MNNVNLENWVILENDPKRREFRQAVHLLLRAIANSAPLAPMMVIKGGILLAIRYNSSRFTRDVDFSTRRKLQDIDLSEFLKDFSDAIAPISSDNEYGLAIRLQSHLINPAARPDSKFPTLQIKIGYAQRSSRGEMLKFSNGMSPKTIQVDYSFNEWASDTEVQKVDGGNLLMYAYHDLIAEKLRSVLQQSIRGRSRFQDIYDLCLLLGCTELLEEDKQSILEKLRASSKERQVPINDMALRQPEIIELSRKDYQSIEALVKDPPPDFATAYGIVQSFYESLPWHTA